MKGKLLVICDREKEYAKCLSEYILTRKEWMFQVMVFTELEELEVFAEEHPIDLLLLDERWDAGRRESVCAKQKFVLCGCRDTKAEAAEQPIYRYQAGEKILAEILGCCADGEAEETLLQIRKSKMKLVGVYSPVGRVGKSAYAVRLGEEAAAEGRTLYLNLEAYPGMEEEEAKDRGLEELLYYMRQECGNIGMRIETLVRHRGNLDYLAPMEMYSDLKEVTVEEWKRLFAVLAKKSIYETVVLDIGDSIRDVYEILKLCSQIYTITLGEETAGRKLARYKRNLERLGLEEILEKTTFVEAEEWR